MSVFRRSSKVPGGQKRRRIGVVTIVGLVLAATNFLGVPQAGATGDLPGEPPGLMFEPRNDSRHELRAGEKLLSGESLVSLNGSYTLTMQHDGNVVLEQGSKVLWHTNTWNNPGAQLHMQYDGNLVIYRGNRPVWNSRTWNHPGVVARMQTDGNFVLYQGSKPIADTRRTLLCRNKYRDTDDPFSRSKICNRHILTRI